jgi:hypothetical protein
MVFQHHFVIFDQCESKRKVVSGANLGCWRPRDSVITAIPGRPIAIVVNLQRSALLKTTDHRCRPVKICESAN